VSVPKLWLVLVLTVLVQALALPGAYLGFEHDDAVYVLAARALADGGYRFWTMPGHPKIDLFPPGLPLMLLPVAWLFPDRPGMYSLAAFGWLIATDMLALFWLRRRLGSKLALPAFLLFALNPIVLARAGTVMPEIPYLSLTLLFAMIAEQREFLDGWYRGGLVALTWFVRPAGISMLPAALARPALRRDWRTLAQVLAALGLVLFAWSRWTGGEVQEFTELAGGRHGLARLLSAFDNIVFYSRGFGSAFLPGNVPALLLGAAMAVLAGLGLWIELRRSPASPAAWLLLGWAGMHLFWPWRYERYLVPALPFVMGYLPLPFKERNAVKGLWVLVLAQGLWASWRPIWAPVRPSKPDAAYEWVRTHTPANAVLASLFWGRDTLYAERSFVPLANAPDEAALAKALRRRGAERVFWVPPPDLGLSPSVHAGTLGAVERVGAIVTRWPVEFTAPDGTSVRRIPAL
jgi:hypothetical protein